MDTEQVWNDLYVDRKTMLETKSMVLFDEKRSHLETIDKTTGRTSSMNLRWNSQIHFISLKISHKQNIRYSKQIYLGLKIQIKEILTLFKEKTFFETKENRYISEYVNYVQYLMKRWEFILKFQQEIDKLHQFQFKKMIEWDT